MPHNQRRGYALMAKPGRRKTGFHRPIKIKAAQLGVIQPSAPPPLKVLTASNEFWRIESDWEKRGPNWICIRAQAPMERLVGMNPLEAKKELLRLGCNYSWS